MVLTDWTGTGVLDGSIKYAGNSSCKINTATGYVIDTVTLTHNTFLETRAQIIFWARQSLIRSTNYVIVNHSSYGDVYLERLDDATFHKFRLSFWYDTSSNTRWARLERYISGAWNPCSENNMGTGSPSTGTISLIAKKTSTGSADPCTVWFDELEVYI